jgi:hypothetical protein
MDKLNITWSKLISFSKPKFHFRDSTFHFHNNPQVDRKFIVWFLDNNFFSQSHSTYSPLSINKVPTKLHLNDERHVLGFWSNKFNLHKNTFKFKFQWFHFNHKTYKATTNKICESVLKHKKWFLERNFFH